MKAVEKKNVKKSSLSKHLSKHGQRMEEQAIENALELVREEHRSLLNYNNVVFHLVMKLKEKKEQAL